MRKRVEGEPSYLVTKGELLKRESELSERLGKTSFDDLEGFVRIFQELNAVRERISLFDQGVTSSGPTGMVGETSTRQSRGPEPKRFNQRKDE